MSCQKNVLNLDDPQVQNTHEILNKMKVVEFGTLTFPFGLCALSAHLTTEADVYSFNQNVRLNELTYPTLQPAITITQDKVVCL